MKLMDAAMIDTVLYRFVLRYVWHQRYSSCDSRSDGIRFTNVPADYVATENIANGVPDGAYCDVKCCHGS